jgi:hypothetical protein
VGCWHYYPESVATTWALSFEKIEKVSPATAELLRFCAFPHPDGIPEEVFIEGAPELGPVLGPVGSDAFGLNSSISEILKYCLLRRDPNARILEIHRLASTNCVKAGDGRGDAAAMGGTRCTGGELRISVRGVFYLGWLRTASSPGARLHGTYQPMGLRISRGFAIAKPCWLLLVRAWPLCLEPNLF